MHLIVAFVAVADQLTDPADLAALITRVRSSSVETLLEAVEFE